MKSSQKHKKLWFTVRTFYLISFPEGASELWQNEGEESRPQGGGDLDQCVPGSVPDLHRAGLHKVTHLQQNAENKNKQISLVYNSLKTKLQNLH